MGSKQIDISGENLRMYDKKRKRKKKVIGHLLFLVLSQYLISHILN